MANDLKSCYDRGAHANAGMSMLASGMSEEAIEFRFSTAQQAVINTRTGHGDSQITNLYPIWNESTDRTFHSLYQGSPDGPIIWALISSDITTAYKHAGYGYKFKYAIDNEEDIIVAGLFVDDATYFQNVRTNETEEVVETSQEAQEELQGLTGATGGALNPEKSFWWLLAYKWNSSADW